jgi:serine/threonine protein kinase/Tfp pilus assembly protein PilF
MTAALTRASSWSLDDYVEAYETAQRRDGHAEIGEFLPPPEQPLYLDVLRELVRVDLEFGWEGGAPRPLAEYVQRFPRLGQDLGALEAVAFEEYRLRCQAGQTPSPEDYQHTYGVNVASWVKREPPPAEPASDPLREAALAYKSFLLSQDDPRTANLDGWPPADSGSADHARLFRDLHRSDPAAAGQLARAATSFPQPGRVFLGFRLLAELGRGAFGRVYLASQPALASRLVALKVAVDLGGEAQTLARLQHTNICPVYSIHQATPFQALCMPFLGSVTLAHALRELRGRKALPDSGKGLVSTLPRAQSRTRLPLAGSKSSLDLAAPPTADRPEATPDPAPATLEMLGRLSYVEAVLWLGACLADGLAHAHDHGILHRDLKPANVLLTDFGQPLLLDFNLAADVVVRNTPLGAAIGGTVPYMAPEHLEAFEGRPAPVDQRSDLYSLGIILYELLTLQHPFPTPDGQAEGDLGKLLLGRKQSPAPMQRANPAVSPATEAIVRRCLAPDPGQRYQSARELQQDLQCQLEQRPLRYTPEPSLRERFRKWRHRHPRLTSASSVLLLTGSVILLLLLALGLHHERLANLEAQQRWLQTAEEQKTVQLLLQSRHLPPAERQEGEDLCKTILDRYRVREGAAWCETPAFRRLAQAQRVQLTADLGELLLLLDRAILRQTVDRPASAERDEQLRKAYRLNHLAETFYGTELAPRSLWRQRAELARAQGDEEAARQAEAQAAATPLRSARDYLLLATTEADQGRYLTALPLLREATRQEPQLFCAWFALGFCNDGLARDAEAVHCYSTAIALWPQRHWLLYFDRGLSYYKQREFALAAADFDEAIRLRPDVAEPYINRALARHGLQKHAEAIDDLTHALELGAPYARIYFMRAWVRERAGDAAGAQRDREAGLKEEPRDETSWVARAIARLGREPEEALADLDRALQLNPRSLSALQTKAHVLSHIPGRLEECLRVQDRTIELYPDFAPARSGRGVIRARLGRGAAALEDAEEALRLDGKPATLYQVAGIYACLSADRPEHRVKALQLLSAALRQGFGFDLLERDPELDSIRKLPEFERLVTAARALQPARP